MAPFFLIQDFINHLKVEKRYSKHTLLAYEKDLIQFFKFAGFQSVNELKNIQSSSIRSWIVCLLDTKLTAGSVSRKISALRGFFQWMKKSGMMSGCPLAKITLPKKAKRLPSFAKESELQSNNISAHFTDDFDGKRDLLMIEFFYQTGVRLSELMHLKVSDINDQFIRVLGKRNKERLVPISNGLYALYLNYLNVRNSLSLTNDYIFVLNNGNKLYAKFVYRKINLYLSAMTSLDKCSPHVLRHTFATHMLNNGAGLETLKELLGHANLSATQVYTHNSFAQLNKIYSQAHPRGHY